MYGNLSITCAFALLQSLGIHTRKMRVIAWLAHPTEPSFMEKGQCLVAPDGAKDLFRPWWMGVVW